MASENKFKAYFAFLGGQNSAAAPDNLNDNEARVLDNFDVVLRGAVKTRPGTVTEQWPCLSALNEASAWEDVCYGNGLFVAVASAGTSRVMTSPDGEAWTIRAATLPSAWKSVCYGNGIYVAIATSGEYRVMTSVDGITWEPRIASELNAWEAVCYGNGQFVAVASSGTNRVMTSPDGINWTNRTAASAMTWESVCYGNGLFVAVASNGTTRCMTSADGITWTNRTIPTTHAWASVAYGGGMFMSVARIGATYRAVSSTNGTTWTTSVMPADTTWHHLAYIGGEGVAAKFVAVGTAGTSRVALISAGQANVSAAGLPTSSWNSVAVSPEGVTATVSSDGTNRAAYNRNIEAALDFTPIQVAYIPRVDRTAEFNTTSGVLIQLVLAGGNLYRRDDTTPLLQDAGYHMDCTVYNNKMYILIKNSYYVYDGLTIVEVTNSQTDSNLAVIKKCKYIQARAERIYCAGNPEAPNALYFSQVGDPTYFKTGSFVVQAASNDGDVITGLREFNEALLVFKARGVWGWFGYSILDDVRFVKLNTHAGTKAYRTIRNVNNMLYYLSEDGIYAMRSTYTGHVEAVKITTNVDDKFSKYVSPKNAYDNSAIAIYTGGKYVVSYVEDTEEPAQDFTVNNKTMVCHVDAGMSANTLPWTEYKDVYMRDVLDSVDGKVYFADAGVAELFTFDENAHTDRGKPIRFTFVSKDYDMGSPIHVKKIKLAWFAANQSVEDETVVDSAVYVDYSKVEKTDITSSESLVYSKGSYGEEIWGWIDTVTKMLKVGKKGIRARIEVSGDTTKVENNSLFLHGIAFMYKIKKHYKEKGAIQ